MLATEGVGNRSVVEASDLRKHDFIVIPLISLTTIIVMFAVAEISSRIVWPAENNYQCVYFDSMTGVRGKPNCTERIKNAEGPWATYSYNECGYRSKASCGPKPAGTIRMALLGSSVSMGLNIPFEQTFGERAVRELSRLTGRNVELQNLGIELASPLHCYRRLDETLKLHPDVVVYAITPFDLEHEMDPKQLARRDDPTFLFPPPDLNSNQTVATRLQAKAMRSRSLIVAEHFLFLNTATYLRMYMNYGDKADYLREPLTPHWQRRFADLDLILSGMAARLRAHNVPFVVVAIPSQAEAALLASTNRPAGTDPLQFGRMIRGQTERAGGEYADVLGELVNFPHSELLFYPVDSHINPEGQALVSRALVNKCLDGSIAAFKRVPAE